MRQHLHPKYQDKHILNSVRSAKDYAVSNARQRLYNLLLIVFGFNRDLQKVVV